MTNKHQFALYVLKIPKTEFYEINDKDIVQRITHILRLDPQETVILFDEEFNVQATLEHYNGKKSITFKLDQLQKNKIIAPSIICLLPLLKRTAFEESLYALCQMGVFQIQPIITQKTSRDWGSAKDFERAKNIFISAAEQSKQFVLPKLLPLKKIEEVIGYTADAKIFFDAVGNRAPSVIGVLERKKISSIIVCFGPEGDLAPQEKELLIHNGFLFCALTQSILRAEQAVALAVGIIRSFL